MKPLFIFYLYFILIAGTSVGQTTNLFTKVISDSAGDGRQARNIFLLTNQYVIFSSSASSPVHYSLYKLDINGNLLESKDYNYGNFNYLKSIRASNGTFATLSYYIPTSQLIITYFNNNLDSLFSYNFSLPYEPVDIVEVSTGRFVVPYLLNGVNLGYSSAFSFDSTGAILWTMNPQHALANNIFRGLGNGFFNISFDGSGNAEVMMFDSTGNLLNTIGVQPWEFCHGFPEQITFDLFSTSYTSDSGYLYVGTTGYLNVSSFCHPTADLYVVKTNNLNDTAWTASLTIPDYQSVRNVVELSGRYFILFYDMNYLKSVVLDSDGSILMVDTIGVSAIIPTGTNSPYFADIIENGDATLTYIYSDYDTLISPTYERVFIKKDRYLSNTIKGNVYADLNNNCLKDSIDFNLQNILVVAEPGPYYGVTDFTGNYKINVDTGTYYINQVNNYQYFDTACNSGYSMTIFDSLNLVSDSINFVNQPSEYCSKYWVDCAIGSSRRCNNGSIAVRICNEGTVADSNLVLLITLNDNYAPGLNGSLSLLQQIGNSYKFQLPVILPGTCLNANFVGTIGCNARVFSSNCIRAEILHDEQCGQYDSAFDTRQVLILGRCINDTVEFVVKNNSVINESYGFYKIWQDGISIQLDTFRISPGDSIILLEFAGSSTIRLQLFFFNPATVTFFEGAQLSIEGCFSSASTGFVNQLPTNLYHDKFDEVCSVITGPIDPNDKSVLPVGIGFDHSVKKSDILTYKIRFQNVGNDTAFSVLIRDTISEDLDISSIYSGASSHEYEFNIYGDRIAEWFFPNINLPDSFINEQESNGFVDFDIRPRNTISAGSFIRNKAEIYFDFNEPVITNSTENKICDSLTSSFTFLTAGSNINFNNNSVNASVCLWNFGDNQTDTSFNPVHSYTHNGIYNVCLVSGNDCDNAVSCTAINITNVGIVDEGIKSFSISPNPANDELYILARSKKFESLNYCIFNTAGSVVKSGVTHGQLIKLSNLSPQLYWIQINAGDKVEYYKFVVVR